MAVVPSPSFDVMEGERGILRFLVFFLLFFFDGFEMWAETAAWRKSLVSQTVRCHGQEQGDVLISMSNEVGATSVSNGGSSLES
jgi:hypothetical protein